MVHGDLQRDDVAAAHQPVPVRIRFYPFRRVIAIIWSAFSTLFLPALIAGAIRLLELCGEGGRFFDGFDLTGGAAWYTLAAFLVFLYLLKGVRRDVYDRPYIYEILPDGKKKEIWLNQYDDDFNVKDYLMRYKEK